MTDLEVCVTIWAILFLVSVVMIAFEGKAGRFGVRLLVMLLVIAVFFLIILLAHSIDSSILKRSVK